VLVLDGFGSAKTEVGSDEWELAPGEHAPAPDEFEAALHVPDFVAPDG